MTNRKMCISQSDNNETLFWKVFRNSYLLDVIFRQGSDIDDVFELSCCNQDRTKFKDILSLEWMLSNKQYTLLKYKINCNDDFIKITSSTISGLFNSISSDKTSDEDKNQLKEILEILLSTRRLEFEICDLTKLAVQCNCLYALQLLTSNRYSCTVYPSTLKLAKSNEKYSNQMMKILLRNPDTEEIDFNTSTTTPTKSEPLILKEPVCFEDYHSPVYTEPPIAILYSESDKNNSSLIQNEYERKVTTILKATEIPSSISNKDLIELVNHLNSTNYTLFHGYREIDIYSLNIFFDKIVSRSITTTGTPLDLSKIKIDFDSFSKSTVEGLILRSLYLNNFQTSQLYFNNLSSFSFLLDNDEYLYRSDRIKGRFESDFRIFLLNSPSKPSSSLNNINGYYYNHIYHDNQQVNFQHLTSLFQLLVSKYNEVIGLKDDRKFIENILNDLFLVLIQNDKVSVNLVYKIYKLLFENSIEVTHSFRHSFYYLIIRSKKFIKYFQSRNLFKDLDFFKAHLNPNLFTFDFILGGFDTSNNFSNDQPVSINFNNSFHHLLKVLVSNLSLEVCTIPNMKSCDFTELLNKDLEYFINCKKFDLFFNHLNFIGKHLIIANNDENYKIGESFPCKILKSTSPPLQNNQNEDGSNNTSKYYNSFLFSEDVINLACKEMDVSSIQDFIEFNGNKSLFIKSIYKSSIYTGRYDIIAFIQDTYQINPNDFIQYKIDFHKFDKSYNYHREFKFMSSQNYPFQLYYNERKLKFDCELFDKIDNLFLDSFIQGDIKFCNSILIKYPNQFKITRYAIDRVIENSRIHIIKYFLQPENSTLLLSNFQDDDNLLQFLKQQLNSHDDYKYITI